MPITELLDRIPISPPDAATPPGAAGPTEDLRPEWAFEAELSPVEHGTPPPSVGAAPSYPETGPSGEASVAAPGRPPLPSWGVALVGGLSLLCIALAAALVVAVTDPGAAAAPPAAVAAPPPAPSTPDEPAPSGPDGTAPSAASFSAEPSPIPVDLLTRLEESTDQPLEVELSRLLDAMQHGFGRRSAQLDPTLRSYVYRMASRFEWNPDTFRVAVTAPDTDLATARGALLEKLFENAVAAGRLDVGTGVGPHALTLVTE